MFEPTLISTHITRASAGVLLVGGLALLFAPDVVLPRLIPAFPAGGVWLGQMLAAAWLAVAALNWLSRTTLLGGIYGRPLVVTNAALYFIVTMVLARIVLREGASQALWFFLAPAALLAGLYGWLLLRGPFERDFARSDRAPHTHPRG